LVFFGAPVILTKPLNNIRAMPGANSSLPNLIGAPLVAAKFDLRAMPYTNSSFNGPSCATLVDAFFHRHTAVTMTNSSQSGIVGATHMAACFHFSSTL
jgi:hypothetical protein